MNYFKKFTLNCMNSPLPFCNLAIAGGGRFGCPFFYHTAINCINSEITSGFAVIGVCFLSIGYIFCGICIFPKEIPDWNKRTGMAACGRIADAAISQCNSIDPVFPGHVTFIHEGVLNGQDFFKNAHNVREREQCQVFCLLKVNVVQIVDTDLLNPFFRDQKIDCFIVPCLGAVARCVKTSAGGIGVRNRDTVYIPGVMKDITDIFWHFQ